MMKKILAGGTALALALALAACGSSSSSTPSSSASSSTAVSQAPSMSASSSSEASQPESMSSSSMPQASAMVGEIIGSDSAQMPDGSTAMDITKPGDSVTFSVPATDNEEYLHFAFMHAASGAKGWYFAPQSENGIALSKSMFDGGASMDITGQIALFAAPDATTSMAVTADDGELKYGAAGEYMSAMVALNNNMYEVTITNTSSGDFETPFSSGVWEIKSTQMMGFDHMASAALSKLATMGQRDDLYKEVQSQM